MWKILRIAVLLLVLAGVGAAAWLDRVSTTSWNQTLWVGIFPLNGDGSEAATRYIEELRVEDFASIESFFAQEAERYGVKVDRPVRVDLYPSPRELPPQLDPRPNRLQVMWWSLKTRLYARRVSDVPGRPRSPIRVFVLYHDPEGERVRCRTRLGMQKGLIGVVHAFADRNMTGSNSIVIAHETMHTVGATDKYDLETGVPIYPGDTASQKRRRAFRSTTPKSWRGSARFRSRAGDAGNLAGCDRRRADRARDRVDAPVNEAATRRDVTTQPLEAAGVSVRAGTRQLVEAPRSRNSGRSEFTAILGRNGSGKTLTLHTLAGLRPPHEGVVSIDAIPLDAMKRRDVARYIGLLMQDLEESFVTDGAGGGADRAPSPHEGVAVGKCRRRTHRPRRALHA